MVHAQPIQREKLIGSDRLSKVLLLSGSLIIMISLVYVLIQAMGTS